MHQKQRHCSVGWGNALGYVDLGRLSKPNHVVNFDIVLAWVEGVEFV